MKRFFLGIMVMSSLCSLLQVFATESPIQKIYKVESYKWDEINGVYDYLGHGSAVLIGKNKIITNAHVILGNDDLPTGNYNLCISDNFETAPKCKTSLKLLQYDKTNDLAILEPISNISLGIPVEISDRKLDLGETTKVYGYPANGGETITLTEGKVSGLDNGHYKIDANIDAGNSGGGAFDKDGKFIGIPYIASVGYSTLGYIIPISMIQDFMAGKGDITKFGKIDSKFLKYINKLNSSILTQKIDNPYIQFDGFQKNGFTLEFADEKPNSISSEYTFYSKTGNTSIYLWMNELYGKKDIINTESIDKLKKTYNTVVQKKNITLGGKKINSMVALIGEKNNDGTVDKNVVSLYFNLPNGLSYTIDTKDYGSEKKALNSAINLFIKNLKIKKDIPLMEKTRYVNIAGSFDIIPDMNLEKTFSSTSFFFDSSISQEGTIDIKKQYDGEGKDAFNNYSFEDFGKLSLKASGINKAEIEGSVHIDIKKNALGFYYLDTVARGKTGETARVSVFITKIDNAIYLTSIIFKIPKPDLDLEKKYDQFIDTLNQAGTMPFKSAAVGKILE